MTPLTILYLAWMVVLMPVLIARRTGKTRGVLAARVERIPSYVSLIIFHFIYFVFTMVVARDNYMELIPPLRLPWWALGVAIAWVVVKLVLMAAIRRYAPPNDGLVMRQLAPRGRADEILTFALLCTVVGIAEEFTFRWVFPLTLEFAGLSALAAGLVASAVFGAWHVTQGWKMAIIAGALGFVNLILVWWTDSIYTVVVSHAAYDFLRGMIVARSSSFGKTVPAPGAAA